MLLQSKLTKIANMLMLKIFLLKIFNILKYMNIKAESYSEKESVRTTSFYLLI